MGDEGVLVPGAQPGRKGAGCFKLSAEEKGRMAEAAKVAARKLKAQSKHGLGKVTYVINSRSLVSLPECLISCRFRAKLQRKLPRRKACLLARRKLSRKLVPSPARVPRGRWLPRLLVKRGQNLLPKSLHPSPPRASSEKCPKNSFAICYII